MDDSTKRPRLRIRIVFGDDEMIGPGKAELLQRIDRCGSIAAAGREMGMSYKRASELVGTLNAMFRDPLVESTRGGPKGGGALLTEAGRTVLDLYRAFESDAATSGAARLGALRAMLRARFSRRAVIAAASALWASTAPAQAPAETALVAVAANFAEAAEAMLPQFRAATGHDLTLTTGSTGKLYAQIVAGAPFDILLSADALIPARLLLEGKAVDGTSFTYAIGRLALWSADPDRIGADGRAALEDPSLRFIAIANPDLAPYGIAARTALQAMGLWDALQPKIVMGQNIGQTHSLVASGAAELGLVALSAVKSPRARIAGSYWDVPQALFDPIRQDAVLLEHGAANPAARAFLDFLRGPGARAVIQSFGYAVAP